MTYERFQTPSIDGILSVVAVGLVNRQAIHPMCGGVTTCPISMEGKHIHRREERPKQRRPERGGQ
jgi:hypothetical protein